MERFCIFVSVFLFMGGLFSVNAADIIVLKDGSMIDAKIMEMHPNEIRYKRADNLNGPMVFLPKAGVLSIRYDNGVVEIVNASPSAASPSAGQGGGQTTGAGSANTQQPVTQAPSPPSLQTVLQTALQNTLNGLPAIPIAGNNLKFQFSSDGWTALLNGDNFWAGTVELEDTGDGSLLKLKQTHMWPGAAGKAAGKLAGRFVGGAAGSAMNTAGNLAGKAGAVEVSGPVIVLEYKAGPPAKLSYLRSDRVASGTPGASDSEPIVLADGQWRREVSVENASAKKNTTVQFNIANEEIGGQVREVLTITTNLPSLPGYRMSHIMLTNKTMVQTLQEGSGVRFKVLGDGKRWKFQLGTDETMSDYCFYEIPIATKKKVVEIDIPYSKLKQPTWGKKVPFIKSNIKFLQIQRNADIGGTGPSTIKVFDFEIY